MEVGYILCEVGTEFLCVYYLISVLERVNHNQIWAVSKLELKLVIYYTFLKVMVKEEFLSGWP
jgi:hypothetical protein